MIVEIAIFFADFEVRQFGITSLGKNEKSIFAQEMNLWKFFQKRKISENILNSQFQDKSLTSKISSKTHSNSLPASGPPLHS